MKCTLYVLLIILFAQLFIVVTSAQETNVKKDVPPASTLQSDMNDFITLLPVDDIQKLTQYYYANDKEVRATYDFLNSQEFQIIKLHIMNLREMKGFVQTMRDADLNVLALVQRLGYIFNRPTLLDADSSSELLNITTTGMNGLIDDIFTSLPRDEMITMFFEKLEFSEDFSIFCSKLEMGEFSTTLNTLESSNDIQILLTKLKYHNIDLEKLVNIGKNFVGFGF